MDHVARPRRAPHVPRRPPAPLGDHAPLLRLPTFVLESSPYILPSQPLLDAGWRIALQSTGSGSHFMIPGVPHKFDINSSPAGDKYIDFVRVRGGFTPCDQRCIAHLRELQCRFFLDTGSQSTIVGPMGIALLHDLGSLPARAVQGVNGPPVLSIETGVFVIVPPAGALPAPPDPGPAAVGAALAMRAQVLDDDVSGLPPLTSGAAFLRHTGPQPALSLVLLPVAPSDPAFASRGPPRRL